MILMCFDFRVVSHRGIGKTILLNLGNCTNDNLQYGVILQRLFLCGILKDTCRKNFRNGYCKISAMELLF